jgi:flagellar hook-associated protein 3 FlgL
MVGVGRVSTYALHQSTLRDTSRLISELSDAQTQLSSGYRSQNFAGIASQSEQFLMLEAKISRSDMYMESNALALSRINTTSTVLDQVITSATDLKNLVLLRRNNSIGTSLAFGDQLENYWKTITSQLNTSSEGRYLFGGTRTDVPPVNGSVFPSLAQSGVPDQGYYNGGSQDVTLRADDNVEIAYNVRANAPGFQKIYAGMAMAKQGHENNNDDALAQAYTLMNDGVKEINDQLATVNANKVTIDRINVRHESLKLYWKGSKEEIANADIVSLSTQVAVNQGILQAAFQSFAKINSLKLSDFLR